MYSKSIKLTDKFSRLFNAELVAVSKRHRSVFMAVNAPISHDTQTNFVRIMSQQ